MLVAAHLGTVSPFREPVNGISKISIRGSVFGSRRGSARIRPGADAGIPLGTCLERPRDGAGARVFLRQRIADLRAATRRGPRGHSEEPELRSYAKWWRQVELFMELVSFNSTEYIDIYIYI